MKSAKIDAFTGCLYRWCCFCKCSVTIDVAIVVVVAVGLSEKLWEIKLSFVLSLKHTTKTIDHGSQGPESEYFSNFSVREPRVMTDRPSRNFPVSIAN